MARSSIASAGVGGYVGNNCRALSTQVSLYLSFLPHSFIKSGERNDKANILLFGHKQANEPHMAGGNLIGGRKELTEEGEEINTRNLFIRS